MKTILPPSTTARHSERILKRVGTSKTNVRRGIERRLLSNELLSVIAIDVVHSTELFVSAVRRRSRHYGNKLAALDASVRLSRKLPSSCAMARRWASTSPATCKNSSARRLEPSF